VQWDTFTKVFRSDLAAIDFDCNIRIYRVVAVF